MRTWGATTVMPQIGDRVMLQGTRIVGQIAGVGVRQDEPRVSVKVTEVQGKKSGSKAARAFRGAWVHCTPALVTPLAPSSN